MLHVTDTQSLNFQFGAFAVLLFHPVVFLALIHSCAGQSQLIVPSQPIVALVGDDIILPCRLEPAMNAFDVIVEWARPDLDPRFVVVWRDGVELDHKKHPSYRGRTSVFTDELKHGNVSLKLSNVRRSDEGTYRCFIPAIDRAQTVQLAVGAVSSPVIHTTKTISEVVLQCESAGWYPEPEVLWLDAEGKLLSAGPTETLRGPDDLYTVSSRVTVDKRHGNNFTCRVHQKNMDQTRETHVLLPDDFFMVPSTPSTPGAPVTPGSQHVIIGSVIGCAALVFIAAAAVFVVWKQRQKKFKNKRRSHEDGPEQTEGEMMDTCRSDNTGFQVVVEGEEESAPLMAGSAGQNDVDNRGEEKMERHSEHKDPQVGAERETHQNQLVTKPDVDRTEERREVKSVENEEVLLIPAEGENHQEQDNKKVEETEGKRDGREEITETPDLKGHEDTAGGQNQEKELQAETQQQETSLRKMDETKEQPKKSTKRERIQWKERYKQDLAIKKRGNITETPKEVKEVRQEGQQQAVQQQLDVKEDVTEQITDFFKSLSQRGAECEDAQQTEINVRPIKKENRGGKHEQEQVKEFHVDHQQIAGKKRPQEEDREPTQKSSKQVKECLEEQNDVHMDVEEGDNWEKKVTDEDEPMDCD